MKKLLSFVAAMLFGTAMFAGSADLFNNQNVDAQFDAINALDAHVTATNATYSDVQSQNSDLLDGIKLDSNAASLTPGGGDCPIWGIPSWVWGCVLGWIGLLIVYLICQDSDETKKALWGCVIGTVVGVVLYFVVIAAAVTSSSTVD